MNELDYKDSKISLKGPLQVINYAVAGDGGTLAYSVRDLAGNDYEIYVDGRTGSNTRGDVFSGAYPGRPGSFILDNQEDFKQRILPLLTEAAKKI